LLLQLFPVPLLLQHLRLLHLRLLHLEDMLCLLLLRRQCTFGRLVVEVGVEARGGDQRSGGCDAARALLVATSSLRRRRRHRHRRRSRRRVLTVAMSTRVCGRPRRPRRPSGYVRRCGRGGRAVVMAAVMGRAAERSRHFGQREVAVEFAIHAVAIQ
jgi:hypothetical protein